MARIQEIWSDIYRYEDMTERVNKTIEIYEDSLLPMDLLKHILTECINDEFTNYKVNVEVRNGVRIVLKDAHTTEDAFKLLSDMLNYLITCEPFNRSQDCMNYIEEFSHDVIRGIEYISEWRKYYAPVYGINPDEYDCNSLLFVPYPPIEEMIMENESEFLLARVEGDPYISPAELESAYLNAEDKSDVDERVKAILAMQRAECANVLGSDVSETEVIGSSELDDTRVVSEEDEDGFSLRLSSIADTTEWGKKRLTLARVQEILDAKRAKEFIEKQLDEEDKNECVDSNVFESEIESTKGDNSNEDKTIHSRQVRFKRYYDLWRSNLSRRIEEELFTKLGIKQVDSFDFSKVKFVPQMDYLYQDVCNTISKQGYPYADIPPEQFLKNGDNESFDEAHRFWAMLNEINAGSDYDYSYSTRLIAKQKDHKWGMLNQDILIPSYDPMLQVQKSEEELFFYYMNFVDERRDLYFTIPDLVDFYLFQYRVSKDDTLGVKTRKCAFQFTVRSLLHFMAMELFDFRRDDYGVFNDIDIEKLVRKLRFFCTSLSLTPEIRGNSYLTGQMGIWQMHLGLDEYRLKQLYSRFKKSCDSYRVIVSDSEKYPYLCMLYKKFYNQRVKEGGGIPISYEKRSKLIANVRMHYALMVYTYYLIFNNSDFWSSA